jgi:hypothetical protein
LAETIPYWQRAQQHVVTMVGSDRWASLAGELRGLAKTIRVGARNEPSGPSCLRAKGDALDRGPLSESRSPTGELERPCEIHDARNSRGCTSRVRGRPNGGAHPRGSGSRAST